MTTVIFQIFSITKAATAADELFATIDKQSSIDPMSSVGLQPEHCIGDIELEDVRFAYPSRPDSQVLDSLTLSIPARKTTALVGASGSGKRTIVALLERWYDQTAGSITLDGINIRELNLRYLRTKIRLVQQEPVLFSGTVYDNVVYGLLGTENENASEEKKLQLVKDACKDAFAHEFIEQLPEQYYTKIGERARMLSGGKYLPLNGENNFLQLTLNTQAKNKELLSQEVSYRTLLSCCWMKQLVLLIREPKKSSSKRLTMLVRTGRPLQLHTNFQLFRKPTTLLSCRKAL